MVERNSTRTDSHYWQILVDVRKCLDEIWQDTSSFRGRCWGSKKNGNRLGGSHITIGDETSCVTIFQNPQTGGLQIYEYVRSDSTPLGDKIRSLLIENDLFEKSRNLI